MAATQWRASFIEWDLRRSTARNCFECSERCSDSRDSLACKSRVTLEQCDGSGGGSTLLPPSAELSAAVGYGRPFYSKVLSRATLVADR